MVAIAYKTDNGRWHLYHELFWNVAAAMEAIDRRGPGEAIEWKFITLKVI